MKKIKLVPILILIIIILLSYLVYDKFFSVKLPVGQLTEKQISNIVSKVSDLIVLPDEKPEAAIIVNAEALTKDQPFYAGSRDGDIIIVYPIAQKALIYRKNEDKLINVGPIIVDQNQANKNSNNTKANTETVSNTATSTTKATTTKTE